MQLSTLVGAAALLALVPWATHLQEQEGVRSRPLPRDRAEREALLHERLVGAWQLTSANYMGQELPALDTSGYLLVQEGYLAIELHLVMPTRLGIESDQPFFQSGIYRWRLLSGTRLETSVLIGCTNINEIERWDFEPPGSKRTYEMLLSETTLVLERVGESRLAFRKLPGLPFPGRQLPGFDRKRGERKGDGG